MSTIRVYGMRQLRDWEEFSDNTNFSDVINKKTQPTAEPRNNFNFKTIPFIFYHHKANDTSFKTSEILLPEIRTSLFETVLFITFQYK